MGEVRTVPIGELVDLVRGTTYKSALLGDHGPVLLGLGTIERDGGFRSDKLKRYSGESKDRLLIQAGELYVSLKDVTQAGDLLGAVAMVPESIGVGRLTQDTVHLKFKDDSFPKKYLYWLLRTPQYRSFCRSCGMGTTNLSLDRDDFLNYEVPVLDGVRQVLYSLLEDVDAKIDLLHRQNKTLEAMAEALFRQWFVEEAEGWEEGTLGDILSVQGGTTPSTKNPVFWDGEYCWTTPRDLSGDHSLYLFDTARKITAEGLEQIGSGLLPVGTLLLSSRAPVGYMAFAAVPVAINQGYIAITGNEGYSNHFIYLWLKANMETVKGHANGSTFQEISKSAFKTIEITIPPKERVQEFDAVVEPLFEKVKKNQLQTQNLTKLRDTLLPKLMSGEVRVDEK